MSPHAHPLRVFYGGTFDPVHAGHLTTAEAAAVALGVPVRLMPAADPPHRAPPGATAGHRAAMLDLAVDGQPKLRVDRRELLREGRSYTIDTLRELRAQYGVDAPLAFVIGADSLRNLHTWKDWGALLEGAHLIVAERPGSPLDALLAAEASSAGPAADFRAGPGLGSAGQLESTAAKLTVAPPYASQPDAHRLDAQRPDALLLRALSGRWAATPEALQSRPGGLVLRLQQPLHPASASEIRRRISAGDADWVAWLLPAVAAYIRQQGLYGSGKAGVKGLASKGEAHAEQQGESPLLTPSGPSSDPAL